MTKEELYAMIGERDHRSIDFWAVKDFDVSELAKEAYEAFMELKKKREQKD